MKVPWNKVCIAGEVEQSIVGEVERRQEWVVDGL